MTTYISQKKCKNCDETTTHFRRDGMDSFCGVCGRTSSVTNIYHFCASCNMYENHEALKNGWKCEGCGGFIPCE